MKQQEGDGAGIAGAAPFFAAPIVILNGLVVILNEVKNLILPPRCHPEQSVVILNSPLSS